MSFQVGDTVGDYKIVGVLGAGGMGQVYKVRNVLSDRLEAMKVLLPGLVEATDQADRFLREIRVQASLDHPNIAALRTALRIENQLVMIIELVEGTTLQTLLERGPVRAKDAIEYMSQALSALSYAHGRGVIHRDIKPANIMRTRDGIIKLMDFGIAKVVRDRKLTATGKTLGSLYYMSPEQVKGSDALDARSDLYSLGVTFYEAVTGARPFQGETDYAILSAHLHDTPQSPTEKNPEVPPELSPIILKSLAKDPTDRFQSAAEFREVLQGVCGFSGETAGAKTIAVSNVPGSGTVRTPSQPLAARPTGSQASPSGSLEMAYVLFMDIVAYSTMPMDRQSERITKLVEIVRDTEEFRKAQESDQLISLPTGDGMALVFFQNPIAPVQCATEVSRTLRSYPELKLRMGIHTGPVYRIPDINTNRNVAGGGINMAQRVMDCGDAGHILVSKTVADVLGQLSDWAEHFHDLGEAEVKHGVKVHVVNFCTGEVGNPELPQKLRKTISVQATVLPAVEPAAQPAVPLPAPRAGSSRSLYWMAGGLLLAVLLVVGATQLSRWNKSGVDRGPAIPATLSPLPSSPPASPPPPTGETPAIPPPGLTPPAQTTPAAASPPPQATAAPARTQAPEIRRQPSGPAAGTAPQNRSEPTPAQPAPSAAVSAAPAAPTSADRALLQELRERMILLAARAGAVRSSVDNLERQQRQSGLSLRSDMAAAKQSVEYLMGEANASLAAGDAAAAKRNLDLAEQNVEKLERFLGR